MDQSDSYLSTIMGRHIFSDMMILRDRRSARVSSWDRRRANYAEFHRFQANLGRCHRLYAERRIELTGALRKAVLEDLPAEIKRAFDSRNHVEAARKAAEANRLLGEFLEGHEVR